MVQKRSTNQNSVAVNQQRIKQSNLKMLFHYINRLQPISRSMLAKLTHMSPTTVSTLTQALMQKGLVVESGMGKNPLSGRKPLLVSINDTGGYVVSIELLDNDAVDVYLYNLNGKEIGGGCHNIKHKNTLGFEIIEYVEALLTHYQIDEAKLMCISVGVPALIDPKEKKVLESTVIPNLSSSLFMQELTERFRHAQMMLENQSSLLAYAEWVFGEARDVRNLISVDIHVGIGAGMIINGEIYKGAYGLSGELGHISIDMDGPLCKCGNHGCLEIMASFPAMGEYLQAQLKKGRKSIIAPSGFLETMPDVLALRAALDQGDELVHETVCIIAKRLAFGLNNVINLINPEVIVVGGEVRKLGSVFLDALKSALSQIEISSHAGRVRVCYSQLGEHPAVVGGARYSLDQVLNSTDFYQIKK